MIKLYENEKFKLNDEIEYIVENGELKLKGFGEKVEPIIESELRRHPR